MADNNTGAGSLIWRNTGAASHEAAQSDGDLSLGLYLASDEIDAFSVSRGSPISGITIDYVAGQNGEGAGSLAADTSDSLTWTPPGGTVGTSVTIANGETKIVTGSDANKWIRVTRTSASALTGTETVTTTDTVGNAIGTDDASSAEATAGRTIYRCIGLKNASSNSVTTIKAYVATIGTQRVSASTQLPSSGAGTLTISSGNFTDWPDSGFCRIVTSGGTLREIVYYTSRTATALTVASAGRALLGTSAAAGAATDTLDSVPGISIAKEAPTAQPSGSFTDKTVAGETSSPGLTFNTAIDATNGENIGTLAAGEIQAIWMTHIVPAGMVGLASNLSQIALSFDAP